jgi:D-3-phosphoglycerate dehydrogenase
MSKVLLSPSSFGKISKEPLTLLKSNNFEIVDNPYGRKLTEEETIKLASGCIGIIAGVESLS